jgi:hypothetical protein
MLFYVPEEGNCKIQTIHSVLARLKLRGFGRRDPKSMTYEGAAYQRGERERERDRTSRSKLLRENVQL